MNKEIDRTNTWFSFLADNALTNVLYDSVVQSARTLVIGQLSSLVEGTLLITDAVGTKISLGTRKSPTVEIRIRSTKAWVRILLRNDIGLAEAFMLNELECSNLTHFFRLLLTGSSSSATESCANTLINSFTSQLHRLPNTSEQALVNAQDHCSLSNDMFSAFLNPTMTYSAPIWLPKSDPESASDTLEAAQIRKLHHTISAARIKSSDHVLEIGTGWGSFAIEAVRQTGCKVTTVTASTQQAVLARQRVQESGFADRIEILYCDYRQIPCPEERFDKVVSIDMIEHVGKQCLDEYFACVDRLLKTEGGIGVFQCITIPEARYAGYCQQRDFCQRYISPGGHLPTVSGLVTSIDAASKGTLVVEEIRSVGGDYTRALRKWRESFIRNWDKIRVALKVERPGMSEEDVEVFRRKWRYYFCYCEAGFRTKRLGDVSITVGREGATELIENVPL